MPVQWGTNPAVSQSVFLLRDVIAARPAAAPANQDYYFLATDVSGGTLYQSTGAAWVQVAGPVTDTDITTFAGLTDVDMTGVTDGQVPAFNLAAGKYEPAAAPGGSTIGYADVRQNAGVVVPDSTWTNVPFDTVFAITSEFSMAVDNSFVNLLQPGVYLAFLSCYPTSGIWTTGLLACRINSGAILYSQWGAAEGAVPTVGASVATQVSVVPTTTTMGIAVHQDSGGNQTIGAELVILRLGLASS